MRNGGVGFIGAFEWLSSAPVVDFYGAFVKIASLQLVAHQPWKFPTSAVCLHKNLCQVIFCIVGRFGSPDSARLLLSTSSLPREQSILTCPLLYNSLRSLFSLIKICREVN